MARSAASYPKVAARHERSVMHVGHDICEDEKEKNRESFGASLPVVLLCQRSVREMAHEQRWGGDPSCACRRSRQGQADVPAYVADDPVLSRSHNDHCKCFSFVAFKARHAIGDKDVCNKANVIFFAIGDRGQAL